MQYAKTKHQYFTTNCINCNVFVCFCACANTCSYPHKDAYICAAHQNSQDIVNCLEYERKKTWIFDKNVNVFLLFYVGPESTVNTDEQSAPRKHKKTLDFYTKVRYVVQTCKYFLDVLCRARKHRKYQGFSRAK